LPLLIIALLCYKIYILYNSFSRNFAIHSVCVGKCIFFERSFENHFENENKYCKNSSKTYCLHYEFYRS